MIENNDEKNVEFRGQNRLKVDREDAASHKTRRRCNDAPHFRFHEPPGSIFWSSRGPKMSPGKLPGRLFSCLFSNLFRTFLKAGSRPGLGRPQDGPSTLQEALRKRFWNDFRSIFSNIFGRHFVSNGLRRVAWICALGLGRRSKRSIDRLDR